MDPHVRVRAEKPDLGGPRSAGLAVSADGGDRLPNLVGRSAVRKRLSDITNTASAGTSAMASGVIEEGKFMDVSSKDCVAQLMKVFLDAFQIRFPSSKFGFYLLKKRVLCFFFFFWILTDKVDSRARKILTR